MTNSTDTLSTTPGSSYAGFTLKEYRKNSELDGEVWLFEHDVLGCPLVAIKNSDPNKTFTVSFNTIPTDSTGVAHILEHSVLMGSKKYPIKDVFGEVNKGGLTTFLNAMTGADTTYYPFATRNLQEYFNIMDIYCDVVFNPLLDLSTFEQEGWHYHQEEGESLQFQGVVYNEMKGAFSDPIRALFHNIFKTLMPNSTYAHESGGDPANIPDLTFEEFKAFHKKHYHPSNAAFFVYGDAPLAEELLFLQDRFLGGYTNKSSRIKFAAGQLIEKETVIEDNYAVEGELNDKTFLAVGTVIGSVLERSKNAAFQVIANILYNSDASPLKNAIVQSGVCKDFGGFFLGSGCFRTLMITYLVGSEPEKRQEFLDIYQTTLTKMVKEGLDRELVVAELNKFEFGYREEASKAQRGLTSIMKAASAVKYNGDPLDCLESEQIINELREKALNENYFEELIKTHLVNNPATVVVILKPDAKKQQQTKEVEENRLAEYAANAGVEEETHRIQRTKELIEEQLRPNDAKTLALLPRLQVADLAAKVEYHRTHPEKMFTTAHREVLVSELPTNHISYIDIGFHAKSLELRHLQILDLFAIIACEIGTKKKNYQQFAKSLATVTGSLSHSFSCYSKKDENHSTPILWFHFKTLPHYLEQATTLIAEIFAELSFEDRKRIREIVAREFAWQEHNIQSEGYSVAATRIFAHLSEGGRYSEAVHGVSSYLRIKELASHYDVQEEEFLTLLHEIANRLFTPENMQLAITAEEDELRAFSKYGNNLITAIPHSPLSPNPGNTIIPAFNLPTHEAFITAAEVVFASQGGNLLEKGKGYSGSFDVLKTWISRDYLWNSVRQMGGAYGCFCQFSILTGNIAFTSYRDPQVQKTYDAYNAIAEAIDNLSFSDDVLQQLIVGTYGTLDPLQSPPLKGATARNEYLRGITPEFKEQRLREVLATTIEDLRKWSPAFAEMTRYAHRAIIGNRSKIEADGGLFDSFTEL